MNTPAKMLNGYMECKECGHVERFFHPSAGLLKMQGHLEDEHGITEEQFVDSLEADE